MRLLPYLDHLQNPRSAGALVEVRLQQKPTVVIDQVAQSCVQVLRGPIDQLNAVFRTYPRQRCKMFPDVCSATARNLGVGKDLDNLLQCENLPVIETAICKRAGNTEPGVNPCS